MHNSAGRWAGADCFLNADNHIPHAENHFLYTEFHFLHTENHSLYTELRFLHTENRSLYTELRFLYTECPCPLSLRLNADPPCGSMLGFMIIFYLLMPALDRFTANVPGLGGRTAGVLAVPAEQDPRGFARGPSRPDYARLDGIQSRQQAKSRKFVKAFLHYRVDYAGSGPRPCRHVFMRYRGRAAQHPVHGKHA
jgi:hypothetical protein